MFAVDDFDHVFGRLFRMCLKEAPRIDEAVQIARAAYVSIGLDEDFDAAIAALRHCLLIRDQYARRAFSNDNEVWPASTSPEELAKWRSPITDLLALGFFHVDAALVQEQEAFFGYVGQYLLWLDYEGRCKAGTLNRGTQKPAPLPFPACGDDGR